MLTLAEFLETGRLGAITHGAAKGLVLEFLGEPSDRSLQKNPEIWKYGCLELSFYKGRSDAEQRLSLVALYFQKEQEPLPESLKMTGWLPSAETTFEQFQSYLAENNIAAALAAPAESADQLVMPSGVRVLFEQGKLHSLQFALPRKAAGRQLSVWIPDAVWEVLRREAAQHKVSLSEYCSQWINERASSLTQIHP